MDVSYETVRRWVLKFGPLFARELRRGRQRPTSQWHLDEMAVVIGGKQSWLWRTVDSKGEVLDLLVQRRRNKAVAAKLMRRLLKKQGFPPDVIITDKLRFYDAAKIEMGLIARHEQGLRKNNRAEIHTSRCDDANSRCKGSSHPGQPSAFSRYMPLSTTTSTSSATSPPAPRSAFSDAQRLRLGEERLRPNQKIRS